MYVFIARIAFGINLLTILQFIMESNLTKVEQHTLHKILPNNRLENIPQLKERAQREKIINTPSTGILEQVFRRKQSLNSKEKKKLQRKCGITPFQVRVWFINKQWLTNNYAEVRGDGYWEDVFVHLAL
nr:CFF_HP1_G0004350.mRNA.1.CDS.1 [Saccharomyces cerevisiae]